jgi:hypothetical protein
LLVSQAPETQLIKETIDWIIGGALFLGFRTTNQYSDAVDVVGFESIPKLFSCLLLNGFSLY